MTALQHADPPASVSAGTLRGIPFRLTRAILLGLLVPVLRLRIEGLEQVPRSGPVIVVCNHLHNADPILLSVAFPRSLHYMAKIELFSIPIVAPIIRRVGAFPVDRGKADRSALRHAEAVLAEGIAVGMFPEGTRSTTRALRRALPGAGMLALRSGVPIIPATIVGSEWLPGNGAKAVRGRGIGRPRRGRRGVTISFGEPFQIPAEVGAQRASIQAATDLIMTVIARRLPLDYRGEYRDAVDTSTTPGS